jgi:hypothetical protein
LLIAFVTAFQRVLHEIITPGRNWASGRESF